MDKRFLKKISLILIIGVTIEITNNYIAYAQDYVSTNIDDIADTRSCYNKIKEEDIKGTDVINEMIGDNKKYALSNIQEQDMFFSKILEDAIIDLTNDFRERNGVAPLKTSEVLRFSARYKCASMCNLNYFDHINPNMNNYRSGSLFTNLGCTNWDYVGENILKYGYFMDNKKISAYDIYKLWEESAGHRSNMLDPDFQYIGIGVCISEDGMIYSTQHFFENDDNKEPVNKQIKLLEMDNVQEDTTLPTKPDDSKTDITTIPTDSKTDTTLPTKPNDSKVDTTIPTDSKTDTTLPTKPDDSKTDITTIPTDSKTDTTLSTKPDDSKVDTTISEDPKADIATSTPTDSKVDTMKIENIKITYSNKTITVQIPDTEAYDYIVLPDNSKSDGNNITYKVNKSGKYTFTLYDKNGKSYIKDIDVVITGDANSLVFLSVSSLLSLVTLIVYRKAKLN